MLNNPIFNLYKLQLGGAPPELIRGAEQAAADFRRRRLENAKRSRPYWLPVEVALDGVATKAKPATHTALDFPLLVAGAITNLTSAISLRVTKVGSDRGWSAEPIDAHALAGAAPGVAGMNHPFYFDPPEILEARNSLVVDFKQPAAGPVTTTGYLIFECLRMLAYSDRAAQLDPATDGAAIAALAERPRSFFLRMAVNWDTEGATADGDTLDARLTPQQDFPLLVLGATTDFTNCRAKFTSPDGVEWSPSRVPIWAIAGRHNTAKQPYIYFPQPVYLPPNTSLRADFMNGINGTPETADGEVTFICTTP